MFEMKMKHMLKKKVHWAFVLFKVSEAKRPVQSSHTELQDWAEKKYLNEHLLLHKYLSTKNTHSRLVAFLFLLLYSVLSFEKCHYSVVLEEYFTTLKYLSSSFHYFTNFCVSSLCHLCHSIGQHHSRTLIVTNTSPMMAVVCHRRGVLPTTSCTAVNF